MLVTARRVVVELSMVRAEAARCLDAGIAGDDEFVMKDVVLVLLHGQYIGASAGAGTGTDVLAMQQN